MVFDEHGQAATYEDKVHICQHSYRLLRTKLALQPAGFCRSQESANPQAVARVGTIRICTV